MTKRWRATAPGRVNLIGEHIDYNGLPVLPMALDRAVRIDFAPMDEPVVRLASDAPGCEPFEFRIDRPIGRAPQGDWSNYVRAAARGLLEEAGPLAEAGPAAGARPRPSELRGIAGQVHGDLPIASGLASSSALVIASALSLLKANDATVTPLQLAETMARAERFVGVRGGAMDQAACLCGAAGHAVRIDFDPLRISTVAVPDSWRWIVASSLDRAEKSRGARAAYNNRASACREALAQVARACELEGPDGQFSYRALVAAFSLPELLERSRGVLADDLFGRFRHVVTEGHRVPLAEQAMASGDLAAFGQLMIQSHASLRDDYEVSTPALDRIVSIATEAGAAGARLTGAGFGGCAVILCDRRSARAVREALARRFYANRLPRQQSGLPPEDILLAARPAQGASVTAV